MLLLTSGVVTKRNGPEISVATRQSLLTEFPLYCPKCNRGVGPIGNRR